MDSRGLREDIMLKMYVWEEVLTDYTDGLACVLAHSEEEARRLIKAEVGRFWEGDFNSKPIEVKSPQAFFVHGGG